MPATSLYPSTIAFALCFSLSLRRAGDPPCPRHSERPLFVPQRRSACQPLPLIPPTMPDRAAPRQTASEYAGESSGKAVWANPAQNPAIPRPYPGQAPGQPTTNPRPTHDQPTTNPRPTPGQPPANPRPTPGGQPPANPTANPFRVTPRPYMARRAAPALKMPVSIFTYTFVFPRRCIFSTVGSRRLFGDRSAGRGMASPDRPTARPSRGNRAGGGNVQEKDPLRGAQDTKEDAYGDDERGA